MRCGEFRDLLDVLCPQGYYSLKIDNLNINNNRSEGDNNYEKGWAQEKRVNHEILWAGNGFCKDLEKSVGSGLHRLLQRQKGVHSLHNVRIIVMYLKLGFGCNHLEVLCVATFLFF